MDRMEVLRAQRVVEEMEVEVASVEHYRFAVAAVDGNGQVQHA